MRSRGEAEMTKPLARTAERQHGSTACLEDRPQGARTTAAQGSQGEASAVSADFNPLMLRYSFLELPCFLWYWFSIYSTGNNDPAFSNK